MSEEDFKDVSAGFGDDSETDEEMGEDEESEEETLDEEDPL